MIQTRQLLAAIVAVGLASVPAQGQVSTNSDAKEIIDGVHTVYEMIDDMIANLAEPKHSTDGRPINNLLMVTHFQSLFPKGQPLDAWVWTDDKGAIVEITPFEQVSMHDESRHVHHDTSMVGAAVEDNVRARMTNGKYEVVTSAGRSVENPSDLAAGRPPAGVVMRQGPLNEADRDRQWREVWEQGRQHVLTKAQADLLGVLKQSLLNSASIKQVDVPDPKDESTRVFLGRDEWFDYSMPIFALSELGRRLLEVRSASEFESVLQTYAEQRRFHRERIRATLIDKMKAQLAELKESRRCAQAQVDYVVNQSGTWKTAESQRDRLRLEWERLDRVPIPKDQGGYTPAYEARLKEYNRDYAKYERDLEQYRREVAAWNAWVQSETERRERASDRDHDRPSQSGSSNRVDSDHIKDRIESGTGINIH